MHYLTKYVQFFLLFVVMALVNPLFADAPRAPMPTLEITPIKGFSPLTVHAKASAVDPNPLDTVSFLWDVPLAASILHPQNAETDITFIGAGDYDVSVTATDDSVTRLSATSPVRKVTVLPIDFHKNKFTKTVQKTFFTSII